ncbi:MAG: DUF4097 family beta strand repeat-containing protein [Acidobacteriota bacterium]
MTTERLSHTMPMMRAPSTDSSEAPATRANRVVVWILLALGLLLMLVSAGHAEQPSVTRVERFHGPMSSGQTIHVENVSGDVVASAGKEFSAAVTIQVFAATEKKAQEILQSTKIVSDHDEDGWSLETHWPGMRSSGWRGDRHGAPCSNCKIVARYEIVVPPGVTAELQTVNGDVRVRDCSGDLNLETVNGMIEARGVRQSLDAHTVNGRIDAVAQAAPADASFQLQSVNGAVALTLPKDAKFNLSASTMNGTILSTFPLPVRGAEISGGDAPRRDGSKGPRVDREKRVIVETDEDGETTEVDLRELEHELESTMKDVASAIEEGTHAGEHDAHEGAREAQRELRRIRVQSPGREYSGSIGKGGADLSLETLNGAIVLLAAGTQEADAKPLVSEKRSFVVTIPKVHVPRVQVRVPPVPPIAPAPPAPRVEPVPPPEFEREVVRGDIAGDFLSTSTGGNYQVGKVTGRVKILTHSGEIHLASAGAGADLKSFGGDIVVGPVTGDLKASTSAGEIHAETVSGSLLADTAGGDIRADRVGASLDAKTAGGDIVVPRVGGGVRAVTAGGDIRIGVSSREIPGGITIHNSGGDVTLYLPADCKADVDLSVTGADEDESAIRSDFPDLSFSKRPGAQRATAKLNGGGEKVVVRTSSGMIRLKKGNSP